MFYHGSCSVANIKDKLLPPSRTNVISEVGRKKNLDRVFITKDIKLAVIYAGRAARSIGGEPKLYKVKNPIDLVCMSTTPGASIYHVSTADAEEISYDFRRKS